jgi:outer membrane protein OmpA-like peptidoglycan-associated protein
MKNVLRIAMLFAIPLFIASCGSDPKPEEMVEDGMDKVEEGMDKVEDVVEDGMDKMDDAMDSTTSALTFEEGSWAWTLEDFLTNGTGTKSFDLNELTAEKDEEISAEGKAQLDALAKILMAHPDLKAEVQAHTKEASNDVARAAKKTGSAARALWVKAKLTARGVDGDQLSSEGYADKMLLEGVDGKDDTQRRVSIAFTK